MNRVELQAVRDRAADALDALRAGKGSQAVEQLLERDLPDLLEGFESLRREHERLVTHARLMARTSELPRTAAVEQWLRDLSMLEGREDTFPPTPVIVTLCGSTRFLEAFRDAKYRETLAGRIVMTVGHDYLSDDELFHELEPAEKDRIKAVLDELHLRKIELSDEILVLNVGGYVGKSTGEEIAHARKLGKRIRWLEPDRAL